MQLHGIDAGAFLRKLIGDQSGQREVHVIAAEQDVFADGHAFERQLALLFRNRDEREVRRAAADVDDQDEVTELDALAPVLVAIDPGVEGCLRLFEKGDATVTRPLGGL